MMIHEGINIDNEPVEPTRPNGLRRIIGISLFLGLAMSLLITVGYFAAHRRTLQREISGRIEERDQLQAITDRLSAAESQAESDKRIVLNLLGLCRSVEDIPDLPGGRIVAARKEAGTICMYVPDGRHTLEIQSEWGPASRKQKFASGEIPGAAGVKTWHVPLLPCSGYWLTLRADRSEEPIQWELTSNHSSFERKQETLPLEGFQYRGSSYSVDSTVQFPNQVKAFLAKDLEQASRTLEGVRLMSTTFNGSVGDENYAVKTTVRLRSEGPACISASDALRAFILKSDEYLLPYEGDGKYVIRRAQPGDDVMKQVD